MVSGGLSFRPKDSRRLVIALLGSVALTSMAVPALAQSGGSRGSQSAQVRQFDIPAQALSTALTVLGEQAGIQITGDASILDGKRSQVLKGSFSVAEALSRLLAGSGITYRWLDGRSVTLELAPQAAEGSISLGPVRVEGGENTAGTDSVDAQFGEVNRFVAADATVALKVSASRLETPYSVSVVTSDQMAMQRVQNTTEALRYLPGVLVGASDSDRRDELNNQSVRGFTAASFVDGLRQVNGGFITNMSLDPYLLERIELLSGPPSVSYGQASPGGAIAYVTKRPVSTPLHEIFVQTGSHNRIQGGLDLGGPLNDAGTLLYRLTAVALDTGTQVKYSKDQRYAVSSALTWRPGDDTSLTLLASYQRDPAKPAQRSLSWYGSLLDTPYGKIPTDFFIGVPGFNYYKKTQITAGYDFEQRIAGDWRFKSKFKYVDINARYRDVYGGLQTDGTVSRTAWGTREKGRSFNFDNQIEGRFDTGSIGHQVLVGTDYFHSVSRTPESLWYALPSFELANPDYSLELPTPSGWTSTNQYGLEQIGIYAQDFITWDKLRLLVGVRQDVRAKTWTEDLSSGSVRGENSTAFTWRAGLSYVFDNGFAPYFNYATSFEPVGGTMAPQRGGGRYKPTTGRQFEAGIKYQLPDLAGFLTLAAFDIKQQNLTTRDPLYDNYSIQIGEVHTRGIEASATLNLNKQLDLVASYTYKTLETTKATPELDFSAVGRVPWYAPEHMASLWANYKWDAGALKGFRLGGGIRYVGSAWTDNREEYMVPAYTLFDAILGYDLSALSSKMAGAELQLNATNLFDKTYLSTCNYYSCWWGDRRRILATLTYKW